jgi:hypothetical protein
MHLLLALTQQATRVRQIAQLDERRHVNVVSNYSPMLIKQRRIVQHLRFRNLLTVWGHGVKVNTDNVVVMNKMIVRTDHNVNVRRHSVHDLNVKVDGDILNVDKCADQ